MVIEHLTRAIRRLAKAMAALGEAFVGHMLGPRRQRRGVWRV